MSGDSAGGSPPRPPGSARPRDRRGTPRAAIEIPAVMRVGGREVNCSIRDLSTGGIALAVRESVAPGMVVRVVFRLPNARQPVEIAGTLVRRVGGPSGSRVGLEFVEPDPDALRAIETFVQRNRSDRPFSRGADGPDTSQVTASEDAAALRGLYQRAVDEVIDVPGKRRGLFDRFRRRRR